MIDIGSSAKQLRQRLNWTQRETAVQLGITCVHLCNIENNKSNPSPGLLDRYRELWGIDLYVLAWCDHGELDALPESVQQAARKLSTAWSKQINAVIAKHGRNAELSCSTFEE